MRLTFISMMAGCLLALTGNGYCGPSPHSKQRDNSWKVELNVETGYTRFVLEDARSLFNQILSSYHQIYVPIPSQTVFPGNMIVGGSVIFLSDMPVALGVGGYYSKTAAISSYQDFSGTLSERMDVNMTMVHVIVEAGSPAKSPGAFIYAEPGVGYAALIYSEDVNMIYPSSQSAAQQVSEYGLAIAGEVGIGVVLRLSRFPVTVEAGYRQTKIANPAITGAGSPVPLDVSGFVLKAALGVTL